MGTGLIFKIHWPPLRKRQKDRKTERQKDRKTERQKDRKMVDFQNTVDIAKWDHK